MTNEPSDDLNLLKARSITRRHFFQMCGGGLGSIALSSLLNEDTFAGEAGVMDDPLLPKPPHFAPRAKRVIYLHMAGSPPQQDLFDYKAKVNELNGKEAPKALYEKERFAFIKGVPKLLGSPHSFKQHGQSGAWVSDILPHFSGIVDEVTFIRSMHTEEFNHAPAQLFLYSGGPRPGRPSMGSWLTYGLGTENRDLPGFVVLVSGGKIPSAGKSIWGNGFLPSVHQGVQCRNTGDPVLYLSNPRGMDRAGRRRGLDVMQQLNEMELEASGDDEIRTRIAQYELAYRMQVSVPEVMDISKEPPSVLETYGAEPGKNSLANNCLLARRLAENGVRFVQLFDWGWDMHGTHKNEDLMTGLPKKCRQMDRPVTALVLDLKKRGLLDETLVVWSGEFGRTAMNEERNKGTKLLGRDHHPHCFTVWMAGGGVKQGLVYGETDDLGFQITKDPVHVHDLQATILHLLGLNHKRLTYRYQGRDFRLTDVFGNVVKDILA